MSSEQEVQTLTTQIHSFFERDKEIDDTWLPTRLIFNNKYEEK